MSCSSAGCGLKVYDIVVQKWPSFGRANRRQTWFTLFEPAVLGAKSYVLAPVARKRGVETHTWSAAVQEQLLRIAMICSNFTGGEAEELRRAMGFKRSEAAHGRDRNQAAARAWNKNGITGETQDMIVQAITSFALYGFPESHAASFALIAYASAY